MPEVPAPQDPNAPAPATPPESSQTPPPAESKLDWRLVVIVALAVLFLIAVYVNKKWYSNKPASEPEPSAKESGSSTEGTEPPPLTPAERYAMLLRSREMEIQGEMFSVDGQTCLIAMPALTAPKKENAKEPDAVIPGVMFDLTQLAEGVKPEMLQRRNVFGVNQLLFMDMFPPLGLDGRVEMVVQPAASVTKEMLPDGLPVLGVKVGAEARAYPVKFMNYHDVINDTLGGQPIVVTWSALASAPSAMYRDPMTPLNAGRMEADALLAPIPPAFGSAGLIYQGAIVMYSKDTVSTADGKKVDKYSLWSPTLRLCIAGERAGARLRPIQADLTSWLTWKNLHADTTVLVGTKPPQPFNYDVNMALPQNYLDPKNPMLPNPVYGFDLDKNPLPPKVPVFGVTDSEGKAAKAYPVRFLSEKKEPFEDTVGDRKLTLQFNPDTRILSAKDAQGNPVLAEAMLWIAWVGAHPKTELWQEDRLRALRAGKPWPPKGTSAPATTAAPVQATTAAPAPATTPAAPAATPMPVTSGAAADTAR